MTLDDALAFLDLGYWPVFQRDKRPFTPGWGLTRPTPAVLARDLAMAGQRAGLGLLVGPTGGIIDVDVDDMVAAERGLTDLFGGSSPPATWSWASNRGMHWLFQWDDRLEAIARHTSTWQAFDGIELRLGGPGKQLAVTIPPSPKDDGQPRRWDEPRPIHPAPMPQSMLTCILNRCRIPARRPRGEPCDIGQDWETRRHRAEEWLRSRDPAISGNRGRNQLYRTLCCLKGFSATRSELLSLAESYNQTCQPPFNDRDLEQHVDSVADQYAEPWGFKLDDPERRNFGSTTRRTHTISANLKITRLDPPGPTIEVMRGGGEPSAWELTDVGNARRFASDYAGLARYCPAWGQWLIWDGRRFAPDKKDSAMNMAIDAVRHWTSMAEERPEIRWLTESQSRSRLEAMLRLARSLPTVSADASEFDADPWAINTLSGLVNLRTGELRPSDPAALCSRLAPVKYEPEAESEEWQAFLAAITADKPDVVDYLQRISGYALTGVTREQQFWTFWGGGRNGKGALLECWLAVLGDYACTVAADLFLTKEQAQHPTSLMELENRRFVFTDEIEEGRKLDEGLMKRLTGGLPIKAHRMRQDEVEFLPRCKIVLLTNEKPDIHGTDAAIWDRLRLVNFPVRFVDPTEEPVAPPLILPKQLGLAERLAGQDRDAIFAWMVSGCLNWQREGLRPPTAVRDATNLYRSEQDRVATFLRQKAETEQGSEIGGKDLYQAYRSWATENGMRPTSNARFSRELGRLGHKKREDRRGSWWLDLRLSPF